MISGATQVLGVIGHPVAHTASPAMHNAALAALGLDYVYVAFCVRPHQLATAIGGMRALGVAGLNVTVPHKRAAMEHLDEISPAARAIGAVNTIVRRGDRLSGDNTDAYGIMESLRRDGGLEELPPKVALLGAGGAARAILYALLQQREVEEVLLLNRTVERAAALAADLDESGRVRVGPLHMGGVEEVGLLINSTSVGMHPHAGASPLADPSVLHAGMLVADIVYEPRRTRLMREAAAAGARAINGVGMLAWQGARSFELWTGVAPPVEVMRAALERGRDDD